MSGSLLDIFSSMLGGDTLGQLSQQLGSDEAQTGQGLGQAVPLIVEALSRNASSPEGAEALSTALAEDHDGSILDDLPGLLNGSHPQAAKGEKMLGHIFGGKTGSIVSQLAKAVGLTEEQAMQLLAKAAPLVLGMLGKQQAAQGLDAGGLAGYLGQQSEMAQGQNPGLMGMLTGMLDRDHDGSALDDIMDIAGGLLGKGN